MYVFIWKEFSSGSDEIFTTGAPAAALSSTYGHCSSPSRSSCAALASQPLTQRRETRGAPESPSACLCSSFFMSHSQVSPPGSPQGPPGDQRTANAPRLPAFFCPFTWCEVAETGRELHSLLQRDRREACEVLGPVRQVTGDTATTRRPIRQQLHQHDSV